QRMRRNRRLRPSCLGTRRNETRSRNERRCLSDGRRWPQSRSDQRSGHPNAVRRTARAPRMATASHAVTLPSAGRGRTVEQPVIERRIRCTIGVAVLVFAVALLAACGESGSGNAVNGRIAFGKWDYVLNDYRIWTAEPDGTDERPLVPYVSWMSD